jgi:hypothetical protein
MPHATCTTIYADTLHSLETIPFPSLRIPLLRLLLLCRLFLAWCRSSGNSRNRLYPLCLHRRKSSFAKPQQITIYSSIAVQSSSCVCATVQQILGYYRILTFFKNQKLHFFQTHLLSTVQNISLVTLLSCPHISSCTGKLSAFTSPPEV